MNIEHDKKPPIYDKCVEQFGVSWDDGTIFTYGDTIYSKDPLPDVKIAHEKVHIKQQGDDPEGWWERYFEDEEFRFEQELEAYRKETEWLKKHEPNKQVRFDKIRKNAQDLSSDMYGNVVGFIKALKLIR